MQGLMQDINEPLPEPPIEQSRLSQVNLLLRWLCCFILYWQVVTRVSDSTVEWLLLFLSRFLEVFGRGLDSELMKNIVLVFPTSIYLLHRISAVQRDNFEKFVVCSKCTKLYHLDECLERKHGTILPKQCSNILFPLGKAKLCGTKLVNKVILKNGITRFYPLKVYCWKSIIDQLESILERTGIPELCEEWRTRLVDEDILADVYDGEVWKNFKWRDESSFFNSERRYGLMLNVDWFQPFKRRSDYSVGVIYFVIMNLPRSERFKFENVLLGGIIPSLDAEPKLHTFLDPCVNELNGLWKGIHLKTSLSTVPLTVVAALLCVAADIPATRKVCGFVGHSASRACSKCFKFFQGGFREKKDFSGFSDRLSWPERNGLTHKRNCEKLLTAKSKADYTRLSRMYGVHLCALTKLEYFDCVRFHIIDPMHNLFLGTAKYVFKLWTENVLSKEQLREIGRKIEELNTATSIGRIPKKIASNHGNFTAEEWKNWTLTFSMYSLYGILPDRHLRVWERFVLACKILCQPVLSKQEILKGDALLVNFCTGMEQLYGKKFLTCNMHLHCHLRKVLMDYGPVFGFWLSSFERYNGHLGSTYTNNRSVEIKFMRDFLKERFLLPSSRNLPTPQQDTFLPIFHRGKDKVSRTENMLHSYYKLSQMESFSGVEWYDNRNIQAPTCYESELLKPEYIGGLFQAYRTMYPDHTNICLDDIQLTVKKFGSLLLGAERFGSKIECRNLRTARILASWHAADGSVSSTSPLSPGIVDYYISHKLHVNGMQREHYFAFVRWFKKHTRKQCLGTFNTLPVYHASKFEQFGSSCFLPVHRIHSLFTGATLSIDSVNLLAVCAIPRHANISRAN